VRLTFREQTSQRALAPENRPRPPRSMRSPLCILLGQDSLRPPFFQSTNLAGSPLCGCKREVPPRCFGPQESACACIPRPARSFAAHESPDWPGLQPKEEKMQISITFNRVAVETDPGFSVFWLMVFAIAILDDSDRREKERRKRKRAEPQP
jgi:hypothetical protein